MEKVKFAEELQTTETDLYAIVLYNDDVNTFDWVIQSLVEVCEHTEEQAEQCSLFVHYRGKYAVLSGSYDYLKPKAEELLKRKLSAKIES